jgi:hypothetical protein
VVASVGAVEIKRCEFTKEMVWSPPNLNVGVVGDSNIPEFKFKAVAGETSQLCSLSVWRKTDGSHGLVKVEVMEYDTTPEVYQ